MTPRDVQEDVRERRDDVLDARGRGRGRLPSRSPRVVVGGGVGGVGRRRRVLLVARRGVVRGRGVGVGVGVVDAADADERDDDGDGRSLCAVFIVSSPDASCACARVRRRERVASPSRRASVRSAAIDARSISREDDDGDARVGDAVDV